MGTSVVSNILALVSVPWLEHAFFRKASATTALLACLGLAVSLLHLRRPLRAARALSNLASSWLSREIFCCLAFALCSLASAGSWHWGIGSNAARLALDSLCAFWGLSLLVCMVWAYRLRTVPCWNTWRTPAAFCLTAAVLGSMMTRILASLETSAAPLWTSLASALLVALLLVFATALHGRATAAWRAAAALFTLVGPLLPLLTSSSSCATCAPAFLGLCLAAVAELRDREKFYAIRDENP
ncbi:MAG: dimethyl sulfoxide reductase anchor subunit [Myxococcota bacterium]|nr:dimethyl sulfoxide reductase anchor subunit [Myxococcota bacterium]